MTFEYIEICSQFKGLSLCLSIKSNVRLGFCDIPSQSHGLSICFSMNHIVKLGFIEIPFLPQLQGLSGYLSIIFIVIFLLLEIESQSQDLSGYLSIISKFIVTDFNHEIKVLYEGVTPNLFKEDSGVVATGYLDEERKIFIANEILAKHDENYMPIKIEVED